MDFSLSSEQNLIFQTAKDFGSQAIAPYASDWEKTEEIPRETLEAAGELGFASMYVSEMMGAQVYQDLMQP